MKLQLAFTCVAVAAALTTPVFAGTSSAGDISVESTPFVGNLSRSDVRAGIPKASATEWMRQSANPLEFTGYTRAAARADYIKFRAETSSMTGEDSGAVSLSRTPRMETQRMGAPGR